MNRTISIIIILFNGIASLAQQDFHVTTDGKPTGDGSLEKPWDLQTALSHPKTIKDGDVIWLHSGIYSGRFNSKLQSSSPSEKITVSGFKNEKVILNGNVESSQEAVLNVTGKNVIYKNFEISPVNLKTRNQTEHGFRIFTGLYHTSGTNCEFINLIIKGNNGLGFGSWNQTGGSVIRNCMIYDNGFINNKGKGIGEGMYVQNSSDNETRIIKDNIIFNNYYKGIEVWSAAKRPGRSYVKNVLIENNVIFNSGLVANRTVDNIIIATDDREGINIAKKIVVRNNILFHDLNFNESNVNGDAPSLTIGYRNTAPVENVIVQNNIIFGKNNPLRILHAKSFEFNDNIVYGGYVHSQYENFQKNYNKEWNFYNNQYFTKNSTPIRLIGDKKYNLNLWKSTYNLDENSNWNSISQLKLDEVLNITPNAYSPNSYRVVTFSDYDEALSIDFSKYDIKENTHYTVKDVARMDDVLTEGKFSSDNNITIAQTSNIQDIRGFKVYIVKFNSEKSEEKKEKSFLQKLFDRIKF